MRNSLRLVVSIAVCQMAGLIGSVFTSNAIPLWYNDLIRPELAPPSWVFAPVWTTLYALMGIAAFLIWSHYAKASAGQEKAKSKIALSVFVLQLALNTLWSIIFFGLRSPGAAFIEIIFLWLAIMATIALFAKQSKVAAWLLVPYILWVSFASYLNYMIYVLN